MDNQNYLMLNGVKIQLTPEQLEQLKSGIKPQVDFSDYNETDWFYYKLDDNSEWLSKNVFDKSNSFRINSKNYQTINNARLCSKYQVVEFRRPTKEEMDILYKNCPQYKPKIKWEDFGKVKGYYINGESDVVGYWSSSDRGNKHVFPTEEEAEACLALSQLLQWRDKYNEGWRPDWSDYKEFKYTIGFHGENIQTDVKQNERHILAFKTREIRYKFLEDFRDLIEIAKPLL